ncbi:MAG: non-heme iron oxygenase ferredoxin subunit [Candidatus Methanomethyliaceae archaeon]|nr:non-heme iron oxygenase ferredoxin subunit [Candidatus Methanomethyliaceae archaeon]
MGFVKVAETNEIPIGSMKMVKPGETEILIVNVDGSFYAIGNRCTHMGGDLSKGKLEGNVVTCPRHGSKFDVTTGKSISGPKIGFLRLKTGDETFYEVKVEENEILIKVD